MNWLGMDAETDPRRRVHDPETAGRLDIATEVCEKLPVLDRALQRVLVLAESEEATLAELVAALEQDPDLAANILRFANSAANAVRVPIRSVRQAVTMVGRNGVRRLTLDAVAYRFFERARGNGGVSRGHMHVHAVQVARLAVRCAQHAGIPADAPHLAGLLHDCGKLVLPLAFGDDAVDEVAAAHRGGTRRAMSELIRFGADHAQAGALLAAASGLDEEIVRAIAWHHGGTWGDACPDRVTGCVQLADQVAGAVAGAELDRALCDTALAVLGLPDDVLDDLADAAVGELGDAGPATALTDRLHELETFARADDLTGLASRRHWLETLRGDLAAGARGGIVVIDIDRFAEINDHHGPQTGDMVLCEIARRAAELGFAGRLGGDEIGIWIADDPARTAEVAERIVRAARGAARTAPRVTVSAGTAWTNGDTDLDAVLADADRALRRAKRSGRDRAVTGDARPLAA